MWRKIYQRVLGWIMNSRDRNSRKTPRSRDYCSTQSLCTPCQSRFSCWHPGLCLYQYMKADHVLLSSPEGKGHSMVASILASPALPEMWAPNVHLMKDKLTPHSALRQVLTTSSSLRELGYLTCVSTCVQVSLGCQSHLNYASGCVVIGHAVAEETDWGCKAKPNKEMSMSQLPDKVTAACNQGFMRIAMAYLLLSEACSSGRCNDVGIIHLYFPASRCIYLWINLACATPSLLLCLKLTRS